jgi:DNA-binding response OmpR family regulator
MLQAQQNQHNILIVDDLPENLAMLSRMLSQKGYRMRTASNGQLALKMIEVNPPALILLDIVMPGMSGYEVCRQLKAHDTTRDIPVIFLTNLIDAEDERQGFEVGGVDYITKPFQIEEVLARIATHLPLPKRRQEPS